MYRCELDRRRCFVGASRSAPIGTRHGIVNVGARRDAPSTFRNVSILSPPFRTPDIVLDRERCQVSPGMKSKCLGVKEETLNSLFMMWSAMTLMTSADFRHMPQISPSLPPVDQAQRNPMFVFELPDELFKLSANTPAFVPLFQLPPRRPAPPERPGVDFIPVHLHKRLLPRIQTMPASGQADWHRHRQAIAGQVFF